MCEMLNLFVPARRVVLAPPVRGLSFDEGGEIQRDFRARFADQRGTILVGSGSGPCLCGFGDWPALYETVRALATRNAVDTIAFLKFWSGDTYRLAERVVDPDDPEQCVEVGDGEVVIARTVPVETRRHRRVVRRLGQRIGARVTLTYKHGGAHHGVVTSFDPESEVGGLDGAFFAAAQVFAVEDEGDAPAP